MTVAGASFMQIDLCKPSQLVFYEKDLPSKKKVGQITADEPSAIAQNLHLAEDQLASGIGKVRTSINGQLEAVDSSIKTAINQWINAEQKVTAFVKEISVPQERAFPAVLYIGVAGMAGLVAARQGLLAKLTYPLVFGTAASVYFLPKTSSNIALKVIDPIYSPQDRKKHAQSAQELTKLPGQLYQQSTDFMSKSVHSLTSQLSSIISK